MTHVFFTLWFLTHFSRHLKCVSTVFTMLALFILQKLKDFKNYILFQQV